jgi:endonuclease YncB( thermonuclease family)
MRPILFLAYSFFLAGQPVCAEISTVFRGQVVGIADGDTITILDSAKRQHKIRLSGIDAPESHQPFGQRSKANLSALVFNREVVAECGKTDKYNRQICKVLVGDADANLEQVKAGMAWWYRHYSNEQSPRDREVYEAEELNAKIRRLGLWVDKAPVPPWEWRHRGR